MKIRKQNPAFSYIMVTPTMIILLGIIAFPAVFTVIISFTNMSMRKGFSGFEFIGFANYLTVFRNPEISRVVINTTWWTISVLAGAMIIGISSALLLQNLGKTGNRLLIIWLLPWVTPDIAAAIIWVFLLHPDLGGFNYALVWLGIVEKPIAWLSLPNLAMWGVIIAALWRAFPFHMTMSYAVLQTLPEEMVDAARIDGVNGWQMFWNIKLPWMRPVLSTTTLLGFIWTYNWFTLIYGMTKGGPGLNTMIIPIFVYKRALEYFDFSRASSFSVLSLLFIFIFIIIYVRNVSRRE